MLTTRRTSSWLGAGLAVLVASCSTDTAGPGGGGNEPPDGVLISAPIARVALPGALASPGAGSVGFVSAMPGTFPSGGEGRIRNQRTGEALPVTLAMGGFDPVAITAAENDTVAIEVPDNSNADSTTVTIKRGVAPRVVRTDPGASRTDVPLNSIIRIVFSAPITLSSADSSLHLRTGESDVARTVEVVADDPTMIDLVPAVDLSPQTAYSLEIGTGVRDLAGNALAAAVTVPFTTSGGTSSVANVLIGELSFQIVAGGQQLMSAVPVDAKGNIIVAPCAWTSSDAAVAAITSAGALSAIAPGSAGVSATCGGASRTARVTVVPSALGAHVIVFASTAAGTSRWYRMDGSGQAPTLIRDAGAMESELRLSPDGQRIAFASQDGGADAAIFVMKSDGGEAIRLAQPAAGSTNVPLGWSGDGTRVFYLARALDAGWNDAAELWVVDAAGGTPVHLVSIPHSFRHALSPDGSMIAFSSGTSGTFELHVMRTDGTHERALTTAGPEIPFPIGAAWSPDGQWIAFSSDGCDIGNVSNLYRVRPDGSDLGILVLLHPGSLDDPSMACVGSAAWSPDGTRLSVSTHDPSAGPPAGLNTLTLVDASSGQLGSRYFSTFFVSPSVWAPDGAALATLQSSSRVDGASSLYLSSPAGAQPVLLAGIVSGMVFLR